MSQPESTYRLRRFLKSDEPDFAAALTLYVRNTVANVRTDTNEITYWLDHFSQKFGNPFYIFGFYRDRQLVGFAEAAYLKAERLVVLDYLVIDELFRRNNVFFEFVDHLKGFLEEAHSEFRYAVVEVCYGANQQYPPPESRLLIRLLKIQGFRIVGAPYYQPRMLLDDPESEMRGGLLIYSTSRLEQIQTETYLSIVRSIYYEYYEPWQSVVAEPPGDYKRHLDRLYLMIESEVGRKKTIPVNGHSMLLPNPADRTQVRLHRVNSFASQGLVIVVLLTIVMLVLKSVFQLSTATFFSFYGVAIFSFVAVAGIVSKNARAVFADLIKAARQLHRG